MSDLATAARVVGGLIRGLGLKFGSGGVSKSDLATLGEQVLRGTEAFIDGLAGALAGTILATVNRIEDDTNDIMRGKFKTPGGTTPADVRQVVWNTHADIQKRINQVGTVVTGIRSLLRAGDLGGGGGSDIDVGDIVQGVLSGFRLPGGTTPKEVRQAVWDTHADLQRRINAVGTTATGIRTLIGRLLDRPAPTTTSIVSGVVGGVVSPIIAGLAGKLNPINAGVGRIERKLGDIESGLPGLVGNAVSGAAGAITNSVLQGLTGNGGILGGAVGKIADSIGNLLGPIMGQIRDIADLLRLSGLGTLAGHLNRVGGILSRVDTGIRRTVDSIEDVTTGLVSKIEALQAETARKIGEQTPLMEREADALEGIQGSLGSDGLIGGILGRATQDADDLRRSRIPEPRQVRPTDAPCPIVEGRTIDDIRDVAIVGPVVDVVLRFFVGAQGLWAQTRVLIEWCRLAYLKANPYEPPSPADVIGQWLRRERTDQEAEEGLRQWGYDGDEARRMLRSARVPFAPGETLEAIRRGVMTAQAGRDELIRAGIAPADADKRLAMIDYILPPQDVIRLAVREVFTPDARAAGNLDADYPAVLTERASEAGMSERDARDLWAAHWELPSIRQGVEMLHRGVITAEQYEQLQRARDVAPGWRDRLTAIQYAPVTRVDLRRLHRDGVIDGERLRRGYRDIGYSPDDAALLAEWTERQSAAAASRADSRESGGLTRAAIVRLYRLGAVDRGRAMQLLEERGIDAAAADRFLEAADLELQADAREDRLRTVLVQLRAGSISQSRAENEVAVMDLEPAERALARAKVDAVVAERRQVPSRADLDRWARGGEIREGEYVAALTDQGWSVDAARRFWNTRPGRGA